MKSRLLLVGALLLQAGCVSHYKSASYEAAGGEPAVYVENRKVYVALIPSTRMTPRGENFPERLSSATYHRYLATGPYSLLVLVTTSGIDNGVPVEVTSAELRFASGETRTILSRQEPGRTGTTQQRPRQSQYVPAETFSRCDLVFPLGDQLVFKADEHVHVIATVRVGGLPQEVKVDAEFKATAREHWGSTLLEM